MLYYLVGKIAEDTVLEQVIEHRVLPAMWVTEISFFGKNVYRNFLSAGKGMNSLDCIMC